MISTGDKLPGADLMRMGEDGPESVALSDIVDGKLVAIFAVPGAYTPTCTLSHLPSFIRNMDNLHNKGVREVICISVNDPFVMKAWADSTDAADAGITMLADPEGSYTRSIGMDFSAPPFGLVGRSKRYAMLVDDGMIKSVNVEESPGVCEVSAAEVLLEDL